MRRAWRAHVDWREGQRRSLGGEEGRLHIWAHTQPPVRGWRAILRVRTGREGVGGRSQGWRAGAVFSSACPTVAPKGEEEGRGQKLLGTTPLLCRVLAVGPVWGEI